MNNLKSKVCVVRGRSGEAAKASGVNGTAESSDGGKGTAEAEGLAGTVFREEMGEVQLDI